MAEELQRQFLCGVIEGFYGKPWTADQRKELFSRMKRFGMNTFMYAPKDDYKHRLYWRDLYSQEEGEDLKELIASAKSYDVKFVYAISPGLDIVFTDCEDVKILKQKLDQVKSFGCNSYALLFDDIEPDLCLEDSKKYESVAHAQSELTNQMYSYLGKPEVFLFCPTEYCTSRADPRLQKSQYLITVGSVLYSDIDVLWTGPKVVSRKITIEEILEVKEILKRPPTIWDNIHANDYDQTRLFLGPYDGRPQELANHVRGVLTNPNCEFELNFIAMHTLAQWSKNSIQRFPALSAEAMEVDPPKSGYQPKRALFCAIEDWIPEFYKPKGASPNKRTMEKISVKTSAVDGWEDPVPVAQKSHTEDNKMDSETTVKNASSTKYAKLDSHKKEVDKGLSEEDDVSSAMDTAKDSTKIGDTVAANLDASVNMLQKPPSQITRDKRKIETIDYLEMEDVLILCDLFYLPYEFGPRAVHLLKRGHWLVDNASRVRDLDRNKISVSERSTDVQEWYEKAIHFHDCFKEAAMVVDKLVNIPNRELLYDLYNYVSDMRCVLSLVNSYIKWNGMGKVDKEPFRSGEQEPWVHRSGIYSQFRRLLPIEGVSDMFPAIERSPTEPLIITVRPYYSQDKDDVYDVCLKTFDDGSDGSDLFIKYPELPADESIGAILHSTPQYCYVIEDDSGICGYAACVKDVKEYQQKVLPHWRNKMKEKYPDPCPDKLDQLTVFQEVIKTFHTDSAEIPEELYLKYPSQIYLHVLSNRPESVRRQLLKTTLNALKAAGSKGVHSVLHSCHCKLLAQYGKLEFEDVCIDKYLDEETVIMGRPVVLL